MNDVSSEEVFQNSVDNSLAGEKLGAIVRRRTRVMRHYELMARIRNDKFSESAPRRDRLQLRKIANSIELQFLSHYFGQPPRWRKLIRKFAHNRTLPDFGVIGPPKSGTSDLAVSVLSHPNVLLPLAKEIPTADVERWRLYYPTQEEKAYHVSKSGVALSPYLHPSLHWMEVAYNFSRVRPNAKIVIVLRNPIERLYSHWKWEVLLAGRARVANLPFLKKFENYVKKSLEMYGTGVMYSACGAEGILHSIYANSVSTWIECFGRKNILVLDAAKYFRSRPESLRSIFSFVGLPQIEFPESVQIVNENPLRPENMNRITVEKLQTFFAPHNEMLWNVIGEKFDW